MAAPDTIGTAPRLFEGLKVLAVARQVAAPFATYQLALHGADVLTIENPREPDSMRSVSLLGTEPGQKFMGAAFLAQGSNKRSMTLNLADARGQAIFRKLAAGADVVVENLVAGKMAQYGLAYADLQALNPRLVYCSITGFGQNGPWSRRAAIDGAIQAASGLMSLSGTQQSGPMRAGYLVADYATGYAAALGIVSALYYCARTGRGQYIDASMLEAAMSLAGWEVCEAATTGRFRELGGNGDGRYISNRFQCGSGMIMVAASTEARRQRFWKAIGRIDLPQDARFRTPELALQNYPALHAEIERTLQAKSALAWEEILADHGVAAMAVRNIAEALGNPQLEHRGFLHRFAADEDLGLPVGVPLCAYRLSETPARIESAPPRVGAHTGEVLAGLGYVDEDVAALRAAGVV